MPIGLKIPVRTDERGRAAVESSETENTKKILMLALSDGDDKNPFQDLGINGSLVFSVKNSAFQARVLRAIKVVLAKFTELARIVESSIEFEDTSESEFTFSFKYIDLLTGKEETFIKTLQRQR